MTQPATDSPQLKRSLSLSLVTFYGIGTILGAGIYVLVGKVAGYAGMYTPLAFMVALLLAGFTAFSYAELSSRFPMSAGEAVYVQQGLNYRPLSIVVGVGITFAGATSVATLVHGFVGYLGEFIVLPETLLIIALVIALGLVVAWGITESVSIAALLTLVEMGGLIMIIWVAGDQFQQLPEKLPEMFPDWELTVWSGILLGSFVAFYAFIGFEDIVNVAEEVHNPQRNLPRAIILALIITTIFYLLVSVVSILTVPTAELAETDAPLALIYTQVTGSSPVVISLISLLSVLNGALVQIIKASRVLYGMSRQGWLPPVLGRVNRRTRTPLFATLIMVGVVMVFALWLPLVSLAKLTSFITLVVFALINFSLLKVKLRAPEVKGVYMVPFWIPAIGFLTSSGFVLYLILHTLLK